jgi:hypothetical protein
MSTAPRLRLEPDTTLHLAVLRYRREYNEWLRGGGIQDPCEERRRQQREEIMPLVVEAMRNVEELLRKLESIEAGECVCERQRDRHTSQQ